MSNDLPPCLPFAKRTVMVNGAGGGVGNAVCRLLGEAGASLIVTDRDGSRLDDVRTALEGDGAEFLAQQCDASDPVAVAEVVSASTGRFDRIDAVVNCFGLFEISSYDRIGDADWSRVMAANLTACFVVCRAVLAEMVRERRGSVVNFASTAGEHGSTRPAAHYAAAKGGVIALSKSLAREVSPFGVRVNVISPGPVNTPMLQAEGAELVTAAAVTLLNRIASPGEIAAAVRFLVSDDSSYVTGHVLRVNGGALL